MQSVNLSTWSTQSILLRLGGHRLSCVKERVMEFLVEFELSVPKGISESEVEQRERAEAAAAADLAREGHDVTSTRANSFHLPDARVALVYRLEATVGGPLDLGAAVQGHRRIVPLTGGTFTSREISGTLLPGASADKLDWLNKGILSSVARPPGRRRGLRDVPAG
jgi:hypothetical protein